MELRWRREKMNILRTLGVFFSLNITWHDVYMCDTAGWEEILKEYIRRYLMINKSFLILFSTARRRRGAIVCGGNPFEQEGRILSPYLRSHFSAKKMIYGISRLLISRVFKKGSPRKRILLTKRIPIFTTCWSLRGFLSAIYLPCYHSSPC